MRTEFAATAAQVIPVLAFAIVALVVPLRRAVASADSRSQLAFLGVATLLYGGLAVSLVDAEVRCISALRDPAAADAMDAAFVVKVISVTTVLLLLAPFVVVFMEIASRGIAAVVSPTAAAADGSTGTPSSPTV